MISRRSLTLTALVIVVIVLVAVASYFISSTTKENTSAAPPPAPAQISDYGFPISHIHANEGGTQRAADGRTRIGYTASCDDAVRAAVNYIAADSVAAEGWEGQEKTLKHVLAGNNFSEKYIKASREAALKDGYASKASVLNPPIFNLTNCESGKSATVAVAQQIETNAYDNGLKEVPASVDIQIAEQQMVWENDDWKLDMSAAYTRPESQLYYTEGVKEPTSKSQILGDLFTDSNGNPLSREGWMELAQ